MLRHVVTFILSVQIHVSKVIPPRKILVYSNDARDIHMTFYIFGILENVPNVQVQ